MILLTGATGYIGSHIWIELLKGSTPVIGIDNLSNSKIECLDAIAKISSKNPTFLEGDIRDVQFLNHIFTKFPISHVIHLAALKNIQESMIRKDQYFEVNVLGLKNLLEAMEANGCQKIIFSSSAAVYGDVVPSPLLEQADKNPSNYYGETKLKGEELLIDRPNKSFSIYSVSLRYFNVAGRDSSGMLQDFSLAKSSTLFSEIEGVLCGAKSWLSIYGDKWNTRDGTCIRDYLHVSDLARGHLDALKLLDGADASFTLNLGSGIGQTVYEVVSAYEGVAGRNIPRKVIGKRLGDIGVSFANTGLANQLMNWHPTKTLSDMCFDSFRYLTTDSFKSLD